MLHIICLDGMIYIFNGAAYKQYLIIIINIIEKTIKYKNFVRLIKNEKYSII